MSRILLAWELGSNFGHLAQLLAIACHLREHGHEVLCAVKDPTLAGQILGDKGFPFVPTPRPISRTMRRRAPVSFADILARAGFDDEEVLFGLVSAWHGIFGLFRAEILVAEYAPVAGFAANLLGLPNLQVTTGFSSPPPVAPYPCFRPWLNISREELVLREVGLQQKIEKICTRLQKPVFKSVQEAIQGRDTLLATVPELDHYRGRKNGRYIGPLVLPDEGLDYHWLDDGRRRVFAYLRPAPYLAKVLEILRKNEVQLIACIPGIDTTLAAMFATEGAWRLGVTPIRLKALLQTADLVLGYGGHGLVARALLAGAPQLVIPGNIDQWLLSTHVQRQQMGLFIDQGKIDSDFAPALATLLNDALFRSNAHQFADKYAEVTNEKGLRILTDTIDSPHFLNR